MRVASRMFVLILSLLLCIGGSIAFADAPLQYTLGDKINDFSFHTYGGEKITLSEVLQKKDAVLINIWATWCGPCRKVVPIVEEIAKERSDIKVGKINVDEQPELAAQFGVMSIPTLVVMKDGKIVTQSAGARPKNAILAML